MRYKSATASDTRPGDMGKNESGSFRRAPLVQLGLHHVLCPVMILCFYLCSTDSVSVDALWVDPIFLVPCSKASPQVVHSVIKSGQTAVYLCAHDVCKHAVLSANFANMSWVDYWVQGFWKLNRVLAARYLLNVPGSRHSCIALGQLPTPIISISL